MYMFVLLRRNNSYINWYRPKAVKISN